MKRTLNLTPSLEKISRAERKLGNIEALLNDWIAAGVQGGIRTEIHGQRAHVIARVENLPPEDVAWETVEAVGHLRSALDKMLVALVACNGRGVSGVGFPFGGVSSDGKAEPFPTARHDPLKKKLTPEQWALVLAQKPYFGGNELLWAVNELANEDKHRKDLVRVVARMQMRSMTISNGVFIGTDRPGLAFGGDPDFVCPDQERDSLIFSYGIAPGSVHPQINQSVAVSVVFGPIRPVAGKEVLSTLSHQARLVKGIVQTFASAFS